MRYSIRGENIEVTPALREYVEKKVGRLEKYFDDLSPSTEAHVTLSVLKDEHTIEVTIPMPGVILRAEDTHTDMYAATDLVVEKLERQIRKHKTKVNRKFRQEGSLKTLFAENLPGGAADEEEPNIDIVRNKRFVLKPMDAEEAVLQMDMLGHNFFVFTNAESDQIGVVYRRRDGRYGLIEPEFE
ncbi:ribosome hibernation-promoting factor, HPF/YfiA family [Ammoniphilus resinae]|uniref:Ribosome hibernation promoting factor n=1 Tax=Ammoniphilus resinae TaxID=861532 RepID=A0ABS4GQQ9_9BACL|nr:ribosome-associated translation inhibitor RaiA [Ammoniphilus resinae]MBP1932566.1 putative sigma-54 modulation protein [Ammoniphilus resinae]